MGRNIEELQAAAERSDREYLKLRQQELEAMSLHGHGFGHWTVAHRVIAWYDRKRLELALRRLAR